MMKLKLKTLIVVLSSFVVASSFADTNLNNEVRIINSKSVRVAKKPIRAVVKSQLERPPARFSLDRIPPDFTGSWLYDNGVTNAPVGAFSNIDIRQSKKSGRGFFIIFTEKAYESPNPGKIFPKKWESPALLIKHPKFGYSLDVARYHKYYDGVFSNQDYLAVKNRILLTYDKKRKVLRVMEKTVSLTRYKNNNRIDLSSDRGDKFLNVADYIKK